MKPKHREPWGESCPLPTDADGGLIQAGERPRSEPHDDTPTGAASTADAKRVRNDCCLNEAAAHRAQRWRANRQQGLTSGGRRL